MEPQESVFVVYDLKGAGRLIGVFRDRVRAEEIVAVDPPYYRLIRLIVCRLDEISDVAFEWLTGPAQRERLAELRKHE